MMEYRQPNTYHTGHELPELFLFFGDEEYFGPREAMKCGDIHEAVKVNLDSIEQEGRLLDFNAVY
jgi:hypothetical protein